MTNSERFWWGLFGSVLPEFLRFVKLVFEGNSLPHLNWALYGCFSLGLAIFGGLFSIAWEPESRLKAIWVGASFPTLVGTLIQTPPRFPSA
jgi:hypothetical protein